MQKRQGHCCEYVRPPSAVYNSSIWLLLFFDSFSVLFKDSDDIEMTLF